MLDLLQSSQGSLSESGSFKNTSMKHKVQFLDNIPPKQKVDRQCIDIRKGHAKKMSECAPMKNYASIHSHADSTTKLQYLHPSLAEDHRGLKERTIAAKKVAIAESPLANHALAANIDNLHPKADPEGFVPIDMLRSTAIPELEFIWQGSFEVLRCGRLFKSCEGVQAHLSTFASPKVFKAVTKFPGKVQLQEVTCLSSWPREYWGHGPGERNIGLFFFAKDVESYERNYSKLLEDMIKNDLALKGNIGGAELLVFPSNKLPQNSQRWNRLFFLWGVFRGKMPNCLESKPPFEDKPSKASLNSEMLAQDLSIAIPENNYDLEGKEVIPLHLKEKMENGNCMKIEEPTDFRLSMKHLIPISLETFPRAGEVMDLNEADFPPPEDRREHKKMKPGNRVHGCSCPGENSSHSLSSNVYPHLFPMELGAVMDMKRNKVIQCCDGKGFQDIPNLEIALGTTTKLPEDKISSIPSTSPRDDMVASLDLFLALRSTEKEPKFFTSI